MDALAPAIDNDGLVGQQLCCLRGERVLFSNLDVAVAPGHLLQVEGANGSGKSTLLRALCGLVPLESGQVLWRGIEITEADDVFRSALSYVGHVPGVKLDLTPIENLVASRALSRGHMGMQPQAALGELGLSGYEDTPLRRLSAGQGRRVALARLLVTPTPLWLLDEPFTALDVDGRQAVERIIAAHCDTGGMAVVATHHRLDIGRTPCTHLRMGD